MRQPPPIILASSSPRRKHLLTMLGIPFTVREPSCEETVLASPLTTALHNALTKARAVPASPDEFVLAADTVVAVGHRILGKPRDLDEAHRFLRLLSGKTHRVLTGVALLHAGRTFTGVERTSVRFDRLSDDEIRTCLRLGHPLDKAGAYGIQEWTAVHIRGIRGDHYNVVGLPLNLLYRLLRRATYPFHLLRP